MMKEILRKKYKLEISGFLISNYTIRIRYQSRVVLAQQQIHGIHSPGINPS